MVWVCSCETSSALAAALCVFEASICPLVFVPAFEQDSLGHLRMHWITPEWREAHKQRRGPQRGRPPRATGKAGATGAGSAQPSNALPSKSEWDDRTSKARKRKRGAADDADEDASFAGATRPRRGRPPAKKPESEEQPDDKEQDAEFDADPTCSAGAGTVDIASLVPVKYTLLENTDGRNLKMRGEEYRLWAGHGWYWLSCTRRSSSAAALAETLGDAGAAAMHQHAGARELHGLGYGSTLPSLLEDTQAIVNYQRHPGDRKCLMFVNSETCDISAALRGENQLLPSRRAAGGARTYRLDTLLVRRELELNRELEVVAARRAEQTRMGALVRRLSEVATVLERYRGDLLELARTQRLARVRAERLACTPLDFVLRLLHQLSTSAPSAAPMYVPQTRALQLELTEPDLYSLIEALDQLEVQYIDHCFSFLFIRTILFLFI